MGITLHILYIYRRNICKSSPLHPKIQKSKNPWGIVRRTLDFWIFGFFDWKSTFKRINICKNIAKVQKAQKSAKNEKKCKKCKKSEKVQKVQKVQKSAKSTKKHEKAQKSTKKSTKKTKYPKNQKTKNPKNPKFPGDCPGNFGFLDFWTSFPFRGWSIGGG